MIVEGEPVVLVVFPVSQRLKQQEFWTYGDSNYQKLLPKREILEEVWRGSRRCLYDAKS